MKHNDRNSAHFNQKTIAFINSLVTELNPNKQEELEEALGWTEEEFAQFLGGNKELNAIQLSKLSRLFNFSLKAFEEGRVDVNSISKQQKGEEFHLPERYTKGPLTLSNRIFNGNLEKVEKFFGSNLKECAINDMQVGDYTFNNPDKFMSIQALPDLFKFLKSYGLNDTDIEYLGACCCRAVLKSPDFEPALKIPSNQEFLRFFFEDFVAKNVASHFLFKVMENTEHKFVLDLRENPQVAKYFTPEKIGSPATCVNKLGGFKEALVHRGLKPTAFHSKCMHRGDDVCRYEFDF